MSAGVHLHDPQTLYRHWEDQQWSPFAIDLSADRRQWAEMSGEERDLVHWALSSPMVAEGRITTKFSGLVGAYGVWYLREAVRADPALGERVRATLAGLLPAVADALTPPDREGPDWDALGASAQEIREFALVGLNRRLGIIGVAL